MEVASDRAGADACFLREFFGCGPRQGRTVNGMASRFERLTNRLERSALTSSGDAGQETQGARALEDVADGFLLFIGEPIRR